MHNLEKINIFKEHAKTFYLASLFFNKETFEKVINLYSFCRINDDLVDTPDTNFSYNSLSDLEEKLKTLLESMTPTRHLRRQRFICVQIK